MSAPRRARRMLSDAVCLYLLPVLVSLVPWRVGFALLRWLAGHTTAFSDRVLPALDNALRVYPGIEGDAFCRHARLLLLVERCDSVLCLMRSARWWRRQVDVRGDALQDLQPGLLLTSHFGAGNWLWPLLKSCGMPAHFVARRDELADVGRSWLTRGFIAWRDRGLRRSGCRSVIYIGGSAGRVLDVLRSGETIVGMLDLPGSAEHGGVGAHLFGHRARFRAGLATLAEQAGVTTTVVTCGLDMRTGRRWLHLKTVPGKPQAAALVQYYVAHLQDTVEANPEQWHLWAHLDDFFASATQAEGTDAPDKAVVS